MKSLSLKLEDHIFEDTENIISRKKKRETGISMKLLNFIICFRTANYFPNNWKRNQN